MATVARRHRETFILVNSLKFEAWCVKADDGLGGQEWCRRLFG
jgi:hypothetical protein